MSDILVRLGFFRGFDVEFKKIRKAGDIPARVMCRRNQYYNVLCEKGELLCTLKGSIWKRESLLSSDFPVVGDWVVLGNVENKTGIIRHILPRKTTLTRLASEKTPDEQVIAANIDYIFFVVALDRGLNMRKLERYLALASNTEAVPVIIANKTDIPEDADAILDKISEVSGSIEVIPVCAFSARDVSKVRGLLGESETAVFAGASGVGKSTIVNAMCGEEVMHTGEVRENDDKGRHTTTFRYLIELSGGGVIIDTPGLREFGLWSEETDVSDMFEDIRQISENCRFSDCRHKTEPDCAVRQAVEDGEISSERLENYIKMCDELEELDRKKRWFKGKSTRYHRKKGEK